MKKAILGLMTLIVLLGLKSPETSIIYDLNDALAQDLISVEFKGSSSSPHYSQPLVIGLKNKTSRTVNVRIPNGLQLKSNPDYQQDLIVVGEELMVLKPSMAKEQALYAMCTQHDNSSPNDNTTYSLGEIATGPLGKLAKEIQKREDFNTLGQYAVWAVANGRDLSTISGFDQETSTHYRQLVSDLTGRPMPVHNPDDYLTNYDNNELIVHSIGGGFQYWFTRTSSVTIGMFDEQDIIVRELFNKEEVAPGKHELNFEFDATAYTDSIYYIRLIVNDRIRINHKMKMS